MNCKQCGNPLPDDSRFCIRCGADQFANEPRTGGGAAPASPARPASYGTATETGMPKREKALFLIAGILFAVSALGALPALVLSMGVPLPAGLPGVVLDGLAFLSVCFLAVVLFLKRKDRLLGIALGVNALAGLLSFVQLLTFRVFSLGELLGFLAPALLCAFLFLEKQIAPFKTPAVLVCAYLPAASLLCTITNYAGYALGGYNYLASCFGLICIAAILARQPYDTKNEKWNKAGLIGLMALLAGIVLGLFIAAISTLIYGRIYFFDGFLVTGVLWVIVIALAAAGILLSPLAILYPAPPRAAAHGADLSDGYISLGKHIVLCLFTFGIWYWIWIYRTTAYLNRTPNAEQYNPTSKLLLFIFVPFYSIYWYYKHGGRIDALSRSRRMNQSDMATMCLVLGVFIPIVACILMQDRINSLCRAADPVPGFSDGRQEENRLDAVRQLKELLDMGVITQEEFEAKKKQLLGL